MLDLIRKHLRVGGALLALLLAFHALYIAVISNHPAGETAQQDTNIPSTRDLDAIAWNNSLCLQESDRGLYTPSGRNIFQLVSESSSVNDHHTLPYTPTPPFIPKEPPEITAQPHINLTFYGYVKKQGATKRVFVQDGENIFTGIEGEIVDRHYKIVRVAENSIDVQDLLTNQYETLPLQQHS